MPDRTIDSAGAGDAEGSLSDQAIGEIKERIIRGQFPSGASFSEGYFASLLGMSKAPIREALALLRRQGWVEVLPRTGYRIVPATLRDVRDLFAVRLQLESEAAAQAARNAAHRRHDVAALRAFCSQDRSGQDHYRVLVDHYRFHRRIIVMAGNREVDRIMAEVLLRLQRYHMLVVTLDVPALQAGHEELVDAIATGLPQRASELVVEHVNEAQQQLFVALMNSDAVLSANLEPAVIDA